MERSCPGAQTERRGVPRPVRALPGGRHSRHDSVWRRVWGGTIDPPHSLECVAVRAGALERARPADHHPTPVGAADSAGSRTAAAHGANADRAVGSYAISGVEVAVTPAAADASDHAVAITGCRPGRPGQAQGALQR